jgi:predicted  nucleic acid-binding Zn-ribbon protein
MSKSDLYAQIAICEQIIEVNQDKIRQLQDKIDRFEHAFSKIVTGQNNLGEFCFYMKQKVANTREYFVRVKYIGYYENDMAECLAGTDYNAVMNQFEFAKAQVKEKIRRALDEIERLQIDICNQNNQINQLYAEIRELERQEEEARRAAAEAAWQTVYGRNW